MVLLIHDDERIHCRLHNAYEAFPVFEQRFFELLTVCGAVLSAFSGTDQ